MRVADVLDGVLECSHDKIDLSVCRSFKHPGPNAPHDGCSVDEDTGDNGQLWVAHLGSQPGWPVPTAEPTTCSTNWSERFEVGIVRCAAGKLQDHGELPDECDITDDAERQETDRLSLRNAILCCLEVESIDVLIEGWEAVEPQGGCVGGVWTFAVRDGGCNC